VQIIVASESENFAAWSFRRGPGQSREQMDALERCADVSAESVDHLQRSSDFALPRRKQFSFG
jgi:hypothetical protein